MLMPQVGVKRRSQFYYTHTSIFRKEFLNIKRLCELEMVASPAVNASRSGPGYLVSWPSRGDAVAYAVFKARYPSPSFYELDEKCCPLLPSRVAPPKYLVPN